MEGIGEETGRMLQAEPSDQKTEPWVKTNPSQASYLGQPCALLRLVLNFSFLSILYKVVHKKLCLKFLAHCSNLEQDLLLLFI